MIADNLEFQIIDWNPYHEKDDEDEDYYTIQLFGRTKDDKDVCLKVTGFTPYFYVQIPDTWGTIQVNKFIDYIKYRVSKKKYNADTTTDLEKALIGHKIINKHTFYNFSNKKLYKFIMLIFKNHTGMKEYSSIFAMPLKINGLVNETTYFKRYESNIEPFIRFMHTRNLTSCGWVNIPKSKLDKLEEYSNCDLTYEVEWKFVSPNKELGNQMAPFKIMSYDIECISCDLGFPQAHRLSDKVIQIGITMYRYGSMECYEQNILTLKDCAKIKGANVECYNTERELLRAFAKKVSDIRPDFRTGYNIFGFDDSYIYERAKILDNESLKLDSKYSMVMPDLLAMGRLINSLTKYEVKTLSSSALGDNELKFFNIPGTVTLDMMKVIQRDHKLQGYRLDDVLANFIKESIKKFIKYPDDEDSTKEAMVIELVTPSTSALEKDSYIQLMVDDSYSPSPLREGAKYYVYDIKKVEDPAGKEKPVYHIKLMLSPADIVELEGALNNKSLKVFWAFAKDDMHHTILNKDFKEGDPKKIRRIAKYCIKDCKSVNLLLAKLEIIVNSVGMANVCHVPLSYIFLRGQSVKIFSLVAKKCREKNYLIPVHKRTKIDGIDDEDETYEGATVIKPQPGVYKTPISVLDFSSLYPNSMRERNLSPECYILDKKKYNGLDNYIYHEVHITKKDKKGRIMYDTRGNVMKEHHMYAQEIVTMEEIEKELKDNFSKINKKADDARSVINKEFEIIANDPEAYLEKMEKDLAKKSVEIKKPEDLQKIKDSHDRKYKHIKATMGKSKNEMMADLQEEYLRKPIKDIEEQCKKNIEKEILLHFNYTQGKYVRYGILPEILSELLNARNMTKARLKEEKDPFVQKILDSLQNAYKVTANSLYGQTGAKTSPIYFLAIAASTTAIGRERLYFARNTVEENFPGSEIIYGDTDSIFINFHIRDENGNDRTDIGALIESISLAKKAADVINKIVPKPQSIVYEKTFYPFTLVSKKKYNGMLYEDKPEGAKMKSMGMVLKRRDNAPIVKIVVGGIMNNINDSKKTIMDAVNYTKIILKDLFEGKYPMHRFIVSKTLKAKYKKPQTIPHKVLADRMAQRDPGNKPQINDRIPFVFIEVDIPKKKTVLQGDLIEHPEFVIENKLKIDYLYYLEHQIMTPAKQILDLIMSPKQVDKLFNSFIIAEISRRKKCQPIDKWLDTGYNKDLFEDW